MGRTAKVEKAGATGLTSGPDPSKGDQVKFKKPKKPVATEDDSAEKKPRKKRRRKAWKSDIRKYSVGKKATDLLTSKASFDRLVREILKQNNPEMRVTPKCLEALRVSSEQVVVEVMQRSNLLAKAVGGREGPLLRDFKVAVSTFDCPAIQLHD